LWQGITFENLLLVGGLVVLFLTLSRVGLLAFLLMIGFLLLRVNLRLLKWARSKSAHKFTGKLNANLVGIGMLLVMGIFYSGLVLGIGFGLSQFDPRMKHLFNFAVGDENPLLRYANQLTFASRMVYWQAGWEIFSERPWLGVGLGNAGYYFLGKLSGYAWGLVEVRDLLFRSNALLNIKSLWVRLLAETGVIGFSFFACWWFLVWQTSSALGNARLPLKRCLGLAGQLVLLAILVEGFSLDTFALPYYWFLPGLVSAAIFLEEKVSHE
jgi:O-antigen ligase